MRERWRMAVILVAVASLGVVAVLIWTREEDMSREAICARPDPVHEVVEPIADPTPPSLAFEHLGEIHQALALADAGDGRLLVAAKDGRLWQVPKEGGMPVAILDLSAEITTGPEEGLLGVAVDAAGAHTYLYASLLDGTLVVLEFSMTATGIDPASRRTVWAVENPTPTHNGGRLGFDGSGMLLLGIGDGGDGDETGAAQDLASPFGKLLRIDPRPNPPEGFGIPTDNPFVGTEGALGEVWALGLRNPWGWGIDAATDELWVGDVGHLCFEEVSRAPDGGRAANFGWTHVEGAHEFLGPVLDAEGRVDPDAEIGGLGERPADLTPPVVEMAHGPGTCSVLGGHVYRGAEAPSLDGAYLYADLCDRAIHLLRPAGASWARSTIRDGVPAGGVAFGEDREGELYLLSLTDGPYRISLDT